MKPAVQKVIAQIAAPKNGDAGQITVGYFTVADNLLTMTDAHGFPMRRGSNGELYTHKLQPDDNARVIAARLTKRIRKDLRSDDWGRAEPLDWPGPPGIV
jgi:hypothetical protein